MTYKLTRYNVSITWNSAGAIPIMVRRENGDYVKYSAVVKQLDLMQAEINRLTEGLARAKLLVK